MTNILKITENFPVETAIKTRPLFCFNSEEAVNLLSAEQQKHFFSPLSMTYDEFYISCMQQMPKAFRRAGKLAVSRGISIIVIRDIIEHLRKYPSIMVLPDHEDSSTWGYACRFRLDTPWYVAAVAGDYNRPTFQSYHVQKLGFFNNLLEWPPLDSFLAKGLYSVRQNQDTSNWRPALNFLHSLLKYLKPDDWGRISNQLLRTDFWPSTDQEEAALEFTLERITASQAEELHEMRGLCHTLHPRLRATDLDRILKCKHTQVWVARSRYQPEPYNPAFASHVARLSNVSSTMLGFLIGGKTEYNEEPCLHALGVVPDERRRGIATSLLKRFFAQTGFGSLIACTHMKEPAQYECAGLFKSFQGTPEIKGTTVWKWQIPSPNLTNSTSDDCGR